MTPQEIVDKARKLKPAVRAAASERWAIVQGELLDCFDRLPKARKAKVYEVHHVISKARAAYLAALVAGQPLDVCRDAALAFKPL